MSSLVKGFGNVLLAVAFMVLMGLSANTVAAGVAVDERCVEEGEECIDKDCAGVCGAAQEFGATTLDECWCLFR